MTRVFISYRRAESSSLATLIAKQLEANRIHTFIDTRKVDGGGPFPKRLRSAIDRADIFICLLGKTTLDSDWVREEIKQAYLNKKILIPVFQESFVRPETITDKHVHALLQSDGIHVLDIKNIYVDEAIAQLEKMIRVSYEKQHPLRRWIQMMTVLLVVIALLIAAILLDVKSLTNTIFNALQKPTATETATPEDTATLSPMPTDTTTATPTLDLPIADATINPFALTATAIVQQATVRGVITSTASPTLDLPIADVTINPFALTTTALVQEATDRVKTSTATPTLDLPIADATINPFALSATALIQSATETMEAQVQLTRGTQNRSCLTSGDTSDLYGQLLYTRIIGTQWQLFWCNLETGEEINLSPDDPLAYHSALGSWSPDGSKIVFLAAPMTAGNPRWDVWVMDSDGSSAVQRSFSEGSEQAPIWSPLNDEILYALQPTLSDDSDIYRMNINGTGQGSYLDTGIDGEPSLSSDASMIAYTANTDGQYDLYFYNRRNEQRLHLSLQGTNEYYPQWSQNDSQILYYSFDSQNDLGSIYILDRETCVEDNGGLYNCDIRLLLDNEGEYADSWATWALDDRAVVFQSNRWGLNRHIFIMNADGSGQPRQITFGQNSHERHPRWRP